VVPRETEGAGNRCARPHASFAREAENNEKAMRRAEEAFYPCRFALICTYTSPTCARRLLCTRAGLLRSMVEKLHFLGKITGLSGCIVFQASGHDLASGGVPDALQHVLRNVPQIWGIYTTRVPATVGGRTGRLDPGPHID
jgi:hypothetical protein